MKEALVKNAADGEQVKTAKKTAKFSRDHELADIKAVMDTREGRRLMWRYLGLCGVRKVSYLGQGFEQHTLFLEGQRNVGLIMEADLMEACEDRYFQMINENKLA